MRLKTFESVLHLVNEILDNYTRYMEYQYGDEDLEDEIFQAEFLAISAREMILDYVRQYQGDEKLVLEFGRIIENVLRNEIIQEMSDLMYLIPYLQHLTDRVFISPTAIFLDAWSTSNEIVGVIRKGDKILRIEGSYHHTSTGKMVITPRIIEEAVI